jgi:TolA-binding protein
MQKFQSAADTLRAILVSEPDYVSADKVAYEMGWALLELGKQKESVAAFQKLAKDHPNSPLVAESLFRVGEAYYDSGDYDQAATVYFQSQEKAGATDLGEKAIHKLAWCFLKQDKYDKASETFLSQIKTVPNGEMAADATFLVGECNFKQKKWADALNWFGKSVATGSGQYHALALFRSGECAAALEKWSDSQRFHAQVLTPQFAEFAQRPEARYGLGWAHHQQGSFDLAIAQYEKVTEETQTETAAKARFMIGEIHFARKQHKEAIKHFLRTAFGYGHKEWSALGYFEAGRCFEVIKDVPKAIAQYKEMIKKYPKHAKVDTARQRIAALGG